MAEWLIMLDLDNHIVVRLVTHSSSESKKISKDWKD